MSTLLWWEFGTDRNQWWKKSIQSLVWIVGNAQLAPEVTPLDPSTVASVVQYGTTSGNYDLSAVGTSLVYSQLYPFPGLLNYTSGIIHHVRLTGEDFVPCNVQRVLSTWIYVICILVKPISQLSLELWKCFGCFQCIILCVALWTEVQPLPYDI